MKSPIRSAANRVLTDPSVSYASPRELAADASLQVAQRLELLQRWDFDVREQLVVSGEGMAGSRRGPGLHAIAEAMSELDVQTEPRTQTPTQHGTVPPPPGGR